MDISNPFIKFGLTCAIASGTASVIVQGVKNGLIISRYWKKLNAREKNERIAWEHNICFYIYQISLLIIGIVTIRELYFQQHALKKIHPIPETLKDLQKQIDDLFKIVWGMQKNTFNNIKL